MTVEERLANLEKICDRIAVVLGTLMSMRTIVINGTIDVEDALSSLPVKGGNN